MGDVEKLITKCRNQIERLELGLPTRLDARDVSLREQLPFYALYCSATLAWRMAELSRDALECFLKGNLGSGVVLTRAAMESSAATWTLQRKLAATLTNGKLGEIGALFTRSSHGKRQSKVASMCYQCSVPAKSQLPSSRLVVR